MPLIICTSTGTVLSADTCRLLQDDDLTDAEWDALDNSSDAECCAIARGRGRPVLLETAALDGIAGILSGASWSADDLDAIAEIIRATNRTIDELP